MSFSEYLYTTLLSPPPLRKAANGLIKLVLPGHVEVHGAYVRLNPNDPVVSGALAFGVYEADEIAFFAAHFATGMTFLDVGANLGLYTALAMRPHRAAEFILCFEPHAESRQYLEETIRENALRQSSTQTQVLPAAAGDRNGIQTLYSNAANKGDNRLYPDPLLTEKAEVAMVTVDSACREAGRKTVDFLKIDVQGAEAKVIEGAQETLARSSDCILMTEFWPEGLARNDSPPLDYLALLMRLGFALYELKAAQLIPVDPASLMERVTGRKYINLVGLKGCHRKIIS